MEYRRTVPVLVLALIASVGSGFAASAQVAGGRLVINNDTYDDVHAARCIEKVEPITLVRNYTDYTVTVYQERGCDGGLEDTIRPGRSDVYEPGTGMHSVFVNPT